MFWCRIAMLFFMGSPVDSGLTWFRSPMTWMTVCFATLTSLAMSSSAAAVGVQSTTTVITHGYSPGSKGIWVESMASAIIDRGGGIGTVYRYTGDTGVWSKVPEAGGDGSDQNVVLIFNWVPESASVTGPNWRYTQAAGDALSAMLLDPSYEVGSVGPVHLLGDRAVHFIGHSRGASVISEAIRRLALAGIEVDQMTTLDSHPVDGTLDAPYNPNWGDPTPVRWSNVAWADNIWRADGGGLINGLDFDGIPLPNVNGVVLSESALNCCANSFSHSDVHLWYHGTIDRAQNPSDGEQVISNNARSTWWPNGWVQTGYHFSILGGGAAERPAIPAGSAPPSDSAPVVFNGAFEQGTQAGWTAHGGVPSNIVSLGGGNWAARLVAAAPQLVHNRAYLPAQCAQFSMKVRRIGTGATDDVLRVSLQGHNDVEPVTLESAAWDVAGLTSAFQTVSVLIPAEFRGRTSRVHIFIDGAGNAVGSTVELDDIAITALNQPGDVNGDCGVNGADLGALLSSWGPCAGCPADLTGDGVVGGADLGALLAHWTL